MPLEVIAIGRVPDAFGTPLSALVGEEVETFVFREDDGTARLVVPVLPSGSVDGGVVEFAVTDGNQACAPVSFTIEALPPAPGAYGDLVDALQDILRDQAVAAGITPAEIIQTDLADLPQELWPLAVTQSVIDHPENPNSLRALAEGTAPATNGVDTVFLDRLIARTGLAAELAASANAASAARDPTHSLMPSADVVTCLESPISDAQLLDECMELQASAELRANGASNEALNGIGFAAGIAGVVPHPGVQLAATGASAAIWALQTLREGMTNLLPSSLKKMTLEADPLTFKEDQPGPGSWEKAMVTATSKGWRLDKLVLDTIFQIVGVSGAYKGWLTKNVDPQFVQDVVVLIETMLVQEAINTTAGSDFLEIEAMDFGPVDVTDETWSEARIAIGTSVELVTHTGYEPREPGISTLSVRTKDGEFAGKQIAKQKEIEVQQLDIDIAPEELNVTPGEHVFGAFTVTVTDAHDPEAVTIEVKNGSATISSNGDGTHTVDYTAPGSSDQFPDLVTARHTAETGARKNGPPRTATAEVRGGEIIITPPGECVDIGGEQQFTAEVKGFENKKVEWGLIGEGDISDTGLYTAPNFATTAVVTATSEANPDLTEGVGVKVGGCSCWWSISVTGSTVTSQPGDFAFFSLQDNAIDLISFDRDSNSRTTDILASATVGVDPIPVGSTGGSVGITGRIGLTDPDVLYATPTFDPRGEVITDVAELSLLQNTGSVLQGTASGTVLVSSPLSEPGERKSQFLATFMITADPDDSSPDFRACTVE